MASRIGYSGTNAVVACVTFDVYICAFYNKMVVTMNEWEKIADSEPWVGSFYSSVRLKVYGGWLVTTVVSDGKIPLATTVFVADPHHFWKLEDNKQQCVEFLHESEC